MLFFFFFLTQNKDVITEMEFINYPQQVASASLCNYASKPAGQNFAAGCVFANSTLAPASSLSVTHTLVSTSLPDIASPQVSAGEQATYAVSLTLPEGASNFTFVYTVSDPKVLLVSVTPSAGANIAPYAMVVSLLDQTGNGLVDTAKLTKFLTNTPDNVQNAKDVLTFTVVTQIIHNTTTTTQALPAPVVDASFGLTHATAAATPVLTLVAPTLTLGLQASVYSVEAKQLVHITITIGSAGSASPGYDVVIGSIIPPQLHVVANSLQISGPAQGLATSGGQLANAVNVSGGCSVFLPAGTIVMQFDATVDTGALSGTSITVPASLDYCSSPAAYGRYCNHASTTKVLSVSPPILAFVIFNTSFYDTPTNNVAIGERVIYHASLTYPKGNAFGSTLIVRLPTSGAQQLVLSATTLTIGANFNVSSLAPAVVGDFDGDSTADQVSYTIPALRNNPDASNTNGNVIVFEIVAVLTKHSSNTNLINKISTATLNYLASSYPADASVTTVVPSLQIVKTHTPISYVDASTVISYYITITHINRISSAPAYTPVITDIVPPTLYVGASPSVIHVSSGGASVGLISGPAGTNITIQAATFELTDSPIVITYTAKVINNVLASAVLVNNAELDYASAPSTSYNTNNIRPFVNTAADEVDVC